MKTLTEGQLTFTFSDTWEVNKYDESHFFRNHIDKCQGSKAVDILALSALGLFLIEIKDIRGHEIEYKQHISKGELLIDFTQKVRDTIQGLYAAYRCQVEELAPFYNYLYANSKYSTLARSERKITVILFLEENRPFKTLKSFKEIRSRFKIKMRNQLKYLNVRCDIYNK
ncbi:MAG: hypothetical protein DRR19_21510, partial [Candidatus Parabeggiatoa sp. nov. 1]